MFSRYKLHKAVCKGRGTSVGEAVEVMCPEHNHPPDQASNRKRFIEKDNWISALFERFKEGQYSLGNFLFFPFTNPIIFVPFVNHSL